MRKVVAKRRKKKAARKPAKARMMGAKCFAELLKRLHACMPARDWSQGKTLRQAWDHCMGLQWMHWFVDSIKRYLPYEGEGFRLRQGLHVPWADCCSISAMRRGVSLEALNKASWLVLKSLRAR